MLQYDPIVHPFTAAIARPQAVSVFEAAGRLSSFSAAGRELGITQPAVTQHIRGLETALGIQLFIRYPNRVELSPAGTTFLASVSQAFDTMVGSIERLHGRQPTFVLAVNPGIAQRWMVPHLAELQTRLSEVDVRLWLFDRDSELRKNHFDAAIHLSLTDTPGTNSIDLFPEAVTPIAKPALAAELQLDRTTDPSQLPRDRLLHLDSNDRTWMDWSDWFAGVQAAPSDGDARVLYNNHALLMQDVLAGRGIGLGWSHLADDVLKQGLVVPVGCKVTRAHSAYRLLWPDSTDQSVIDVISGFFADHLR